MVKMWTHTKEKRPKSATQHTKCKRWEHHDHTCMLVKETMGTKKLTMETSNVAHIMLFNNQGDLEKWTSETFACLE